MRRDPYRRQAADKVYLVTGDQAQVRQFFVEFKTYLQLQQQVLKNRPRPRIPMQFEQLAVTESLESQLRRQAPDVGGGGFGGTTPPGQLTFYLVLRSR